MAHTQQYDLVMDSPLGSIGICLEDTAVSRIDFLARRRAPRARQGRPVQRVQAELEAWFDDPAAQFTVPVALSGTPFQRRVWDALRSIPAGRVLTYGELAERLDSGARAVGNACRRNPVPVIVPCHRLVSVNGMGGYGGRTGDRAIWRKHWLLAHEGARCAGLKTDHRPRYAEHRTFPDREIHA